MEDGQAADRLLARLYLILCIGFLGATAIHLIPAHQRQAAKLRALRWCVLGTNRLARRAAAGSMALELATGEQEYDVPFLLSVLRDRLHRAYDQVSAP
jgi:hypothetical protein